MNKRLYAFRVLAAVLAALIFSRSATAGKQVPFKGRSSGVVTAVGFDPGRGCRLCFVNFGVGCLASAHACQSARRNIILRKRRIPGANES